MSDERYNKLKEAISKAFPEMKKYYLHRTDWSKSSAYKLTPTDDEYSTFYPRQLYYLETLLPDEEVKVVLTRTYKQPNCIYFYKLGKDRKELPIKKISDLEFRTIMSKALLKHSAEEIAKKFPVGPRMIIGYAAGTQRPFGKIKEQMIEIIKKHML